MKQLYLLLIATNVLSTACMEQQRHWNPNNYNEETTEYHLVAFNQTVPNTVPVYMETNQTNWLLYNNIMDMTYKHDQPLVITRTNELVPIYRPIEQSNRTAPTKKSIAYKKQKPLLQTTNNTKLMEEIYNKTYEFINTTRENKRIRWADHHQTLASLIETMNNAKTSGINEDIMGKFSYKKQCSSYDNDTKNYTTLFFSCLKRYTLTIKKTGETLINLTKNKSRLTDIFDTASHGEKKIDTYNLSNSAIPSSIFKTHSAFVHLEHNVRTMLQSTSVELAQHLTDYLYAKQQPVAKNNPQYSSLDLKNEFYQKASTLLNNRTLDGICKIVTIIETAKKLKDINHESDLGYGILGFIPTNSITEDFYQWWDQKDSTVNVKKRIALLCTLIAQYNNARLKKITPTAIQYYAYALYKDYNLALPGDCKCAQLNKKQYAFEALKELIDNVITLIDANDKEIAEEVARLYPPKKYY